jgi:hypothetical protein
MQVGYSIDILSFTLFHSICYQRLFVKKKKNIKIELSSGDEEDMEPCCSSSLKN